MTTTVAKRKA